MLVAKSCEVINKINKSRSRRNKWLKLLIKIAVTLGFSLWIIFSTNWKDVWFYLSEIKIHYLIFYVAILFLGFFISSKKWSVLARFKKIHLPQIEFFKLYFIATFINNFMPSFIAGDAYKTYQLGKKGEKYPEAASTVLMDRITGLVAATILALIFLFFNFNQLVEHRILLIAAIILLISLGFDVMMPQIRKINFLKNFVYRIAPEKVINFLKDLASYSHNHQVLGKSLFYSFIFSVVGVGILNYILFLALGIQIGILNYLSVIFLISIISALPISINNIGLKEWAYVTFFGLFSVDPAAAITIAIISRTIQMVVSFFALPIYLEKRK